MTIKRKVKSKILKIVYFIAFIAMLCSFPVVTFAQSSVDVIMGAGASFPYPLYSKMFDAYYKQHDIQVNYQSIGSGGGIRQLKMK